MNTEFYENLEIPQAASQVKWEMFTSDKEKQIKRVLKDNFSILAFRPGQKEVIDHVLAGKNALLLMPTGFGKSLCYQLPAKIYSGLTLVISPLIALAKDQADAASKAGLRCCYINSSLSKAEREDRYRRLAQQEYELVIVTPERFQKDDFKKALDVNKVDLLAVDEAHCISQWGHDFRPDYTRLSDFREFLGKPTTLALTATATPDVQEDIIQQLGFVQGEVEVFFQGLQRENLYLDAIDGYGPDAKIRAFLGWNHHHPGPAIVYFSLISTLQEFSQNLVGMEIPHWQYHGDMRTADRKRSQEEFLASQDGIILATPAFGLGIDKPDIRMIMHAEVTGTMEAYYQEIGRAGRDGKPAHCLLVYDEYDLRIQMDFIKWANPFPGFIRSLYQLIEDNQDRIGMDGVDYLRKELNYYNTRDYRVETAIRLLQRWGCLEVDLSKRLINPIQPPSEKYLNTDRIQERVTSQRQKLYKMVEYVNEKGCRLEFIYKYFGMHETEPCGHCDNCKTTK